MTIFFQTDDIKAKNILYFPCKLKPKNSVFEAKGENKIKFRNSIVLPLTREKKTSETKQPKEYKKSREERKKGFTSKILHY